MRTLHIPNECSATGHLPFLGLGGVRATTGDATASKLTPTLSKDASRACSSTSGASVYEFRVWRVQSSHTRATERVFDTVCDGFASSQLSVVRL